MRTLGWAVAAAWVVGVVFAPAAWALQAGAASPDGKVFVAGGEGRVLYVLDTEKWEVTKRIWLGARVEALAFSPDGAQCIVGMDDGLTWVFNAATWEKVNDLGNRPLLAVARKAPVAVSAEQSWVAGKAQGRLKVWSLADWKMTKEITLGPGQAAAGTAIAPDGKTAYVRLSRMESPEEKKADPGPEPKDWTEKGFWRERKDGAITGLLAIDLDQGTVGKKITCFDTPGNFRLYLVPGGVMTVAYGQYHALWDIETGKYEPKANREFAYGSGQSAAGDLYVGSLRTYLVLSPEGKEAARKEASRLPGWPEYFRGFVPLGEALVVGVTDASRLIIIDAKTHNILKEVNCY